MVSNDELYRVSVAIQGVLLLSPWRPFDEQYSSVTRFDSRGAAVVSIMKKWAEAPDPVGWSFYSGGMVGDLKSVDVLDPSDAGRDAICEKVDAQLRAKGYLLAGD